MKLSRPRSLLKPRRGITLVECLIYIGALAIVSGLAFAAFYRSMDHSRALRRSAEDIARTLQAGERWRADIRAATASPTVQTHENELTLRVPQKAGDVTYVFTQSRVWRLAADGRSPQPVMNGVLQSTWAPDRRQYVTAWRWELELRTRDKNAHLRPLFSFEAVATADHKP